MNESVEKARSLANHESLTDDDAIVETSPLLPVNANPCDSDGRYSDDPNVDDAVEKSPLNPMTVDVELYPVLTVNGNANVDVRKPASLVSCDVLIVEVANE